MLALCQHNGATYHAQNYAGIIGASLHSDQMAVNILNTVTMSLDLQIYTHNYMQ